MTHLRYLLYIVNQFCFIEQQSLISSTSWQLLKISNPFGEYRSDLLVQQKSNQKIKPYKQMDKLRYNSAILMLSLIYNFTNTVMLSYSGSFVDFVFNQQRTWFHHGSRNTSMISCTCVAWDSVPVWPTVYKNFCI